MKKNPKLLSKPELENHHQAHLQSKLSRAEYCRQHNLDYKQLSNYASKVNTTKSNATDHKPDFIPLSIITEPVSNEFKLTLSNGRQLSWVTNWSPQQVMRFVLDWSVQP